jgi:tetratricopeptide (TPR) repeat protein
MGRYEEAEEELRTAWETQKATLGAEHPDTVASMGSLGALYTELGRYDEAETLFTDNLENQRRIFGDEHPKTLVARQRLAELQEERGNWDEAARLKEEVLEVRRRVLGAEHPSTLSSMSSLAWLRNDQGRVEEALELALEAFETSVRVLGQENPDTRLRANSLAPVYGSMGRQAKRMQLLEDNLDIYTRLYGEGHPRVLMARNNLAVGYDEWGRNEEANELYRANLEAVRNSTGVDNPSGLIMLGNLAIDENDKGRRDEAEKLALELLDTSRAVLGEEHPAVARAKWILGAVRRGQRRFDETERLYQESYQGYRDVFGDRHPQTMWALNRVAGLLQGQSRPEEALPLREEVLETSRALVGEDHPWTIGAYRRLAWTYRMLNRPGPALEMERAALESRRRNAEGAGAHLKIGYARDLVYARRELQNPPEALRFALQANELSDYSNRDYVSVLAEAYFRNGRIDDAIRTQEKALALVPEDDPNARTSLGNRLAEYHEANGNLEPKRQMQLAEIAREREMARKPDASPQARNNYAWELLVADPPDLQDPQEAARIAEAVNRETGHENAGYLATLAVAYFKLGSVDKAVETQEKVLEHTEESQAWAWPNHSARLRVYRGEGTRDVDLGAVLPGIWSGKVGPIESRIEFHRDGDYLFGRNLVELPWAPAGEITMRFHVETGKFEFLKTDAGWTNPRWGQAAEYRFTGPDEVITWGVDRWYFATLSKE